MYEWSLVAECDAVLEICVSTIACPEKKRIIIITRMLQLQEFGTVKRFQFDLPI